ncbi:hypothetical protein Trydic_g12698 [Trypoxylus dichotomus]
MMTPEIRELSPACEENLIYMLRLCLISSYFIWNGEFYEQASGAAMGSLLSPVIAKIFMKAFEHEDIKSSRMRPKCWYKYVNDTFVIWPHGPRTLEEFLKHINRQHANINFTMEIKEDGNLPRTDSNKLGRTSKYAGVTLDRTLTYKQHRHKTRQKMVARNSIVQKLTGSKYSVSTPQNMRVEFDADHIDIALNHTCGIVSGYMKSNQINKLYKGDDLAQPSERRKGHGICRKI